ncbi:MAG: CHRD domain-containing protein [Planctomycetota bacterium]
MLRWQFLRVWAIASALVTLAACGGGGGGGGGEPPPPGVEVLARLGAVLLGSSETTVVDPDARGSVAMELRSDGRIVFAATAEAAWSTDVNGMHIHRGAAGADGLIEVDLLAGGASFDNAARTATNTLFASATLVDEIASDPAGFYVNIHTASAGGGLVRAQLAPLATLSAWTVLHGAEVTTVVNPDARGAATFQVGADGALSWVIAMGTPGVTDVTSAAIVQGEAGVDGTTLLDLSAATATENTTAGTLAAATNVTFDIVTRLMLDLPDYHVVVSSAAAPQGLARGQLGQEPGHLWTPVSGEDNTVVIDASYRAGCTIQLESLTLGRVHLATPVAPPANPEYSIAAVTAAHIHEGAPGFDGPQVIDLRSGADYAISGPTFSSEGTFAITPTLFARLMGNPGAFYVNIGTLSFESGIGRGQLGQEPVHFVAGLSGAEETSVVDASASALLNPLTFTDIFHCSFTLQVSNPTATDLTALHIHNGGAGLDGSILIDLMAAADLEVNGGLMTGSTGLTGRTFARLMASPQHFYANMHTAGAPAGLARGQCAELTGDIPPIGLSYSTPNPTYTTTVAITPNTPTVNGGAIQTWSITPPLPSGLQLSTVTGIISGTPLAAINQTSFTVTASNSAGSTQATLMITVNVAAPAGLAYSTPVSYVINQAITPNTPSSTGGLIATYGISPALPTGLSISASTGVISGTPTALSSPTTYTVTGTNASGSTQTTLSLEVVPGLTAPSGLSYATNPASYPTGYAISSNNPSVTGTVTTWAISPALPAGLSFSTSTGVITGTPTVVTNQTGYTITASNAAGSTQATLTLTVTLGAPTGLSYSNDPAIGYVTGNTFPTMSPSSSGGAVASYSISPTLPNGVSINTTTGVISGAPTSQSASATYTITASNATGSTQATVTIVVLP